MKKLTAALIALMVILSAAALAADNHLYSLWNEYVDKDLWGDGMATYVYADTFSGQPSKQTRSYTSDDGVILGELGWKYGGENTDAVQWIRAIANNKRINYYAGSSVLTYLSGSKIDKAGTRFLDSQLNTWEVGGEVISEEIYRLQVTINSGADVYEVMVLLVYENEMSEFMESILISHSRSGNTGSAAGLPADQNRESVSVAASDEGYMGDMYIVNCQDWVSLRSAPNTNADRRAKVPFGSRVTSVYFESGSYAYCEYNGTSGYIMKQYLGEERQDESPASDFSTPGTKGTVEQSYGSTGFWSMYPDYVPFSGFHSLTELHGGDFCEGDYLFTGRNYEYRVVNCDSYVTLREEANAYSDAILKVGKGETVAVNGKLNNWMLCRYNGRYGWIKAGYLQEK